LKALLADFLDNQQKIYTVGSEDPDADIGHDGDNLPIKRIQEMFQLAPVGTHADIETMDSVFHGRSPCGVRARPLARAVRQSHSDEIARIKDHPYGLDAPARDLNVLGNGHHQAGFHVLVEDCH